MLTESQWQTAREFQPHPREPQQAERLGPGFRSDQRGRVVPVAAGVAQIQTLLVNCFLIGTRTPGQWVLLDAGIPGFARRIAAEARKRFGNAPPIAIVLSHGHFDHVGSLPALLKMWNVPVYAHALELPYLTGQSDYPPPDPTVGGGIMARSAPLFPRGAYDFRPNVRALPDDGRVPDLPDWHYVHTPGHTPGHVSLYRPSDRCLLAADAFTTQKQESLFAVMTNYQKIHGPPTYFTTDWGQARESVRLLASLRPRVAATGHGLPMRGPRLTHALDHLARDFDRLACPKQGRYVTEPAEADLSGTTYIPPRPFDPFPLILAAAALLAAGGTYAVAKRKDWLD